MNAVGRHGQRSGASPAHPNLQVSMASIFQVWAELRSVRSLFSTLINPSNINPNSSPHEPSKLFNVKNKNNKNPIPIPHRTILEPKGQDLDYVHVAHSHLLHSDWPKLEKLAPLLTPFRVKHILLKTHKDYVLSLEFFNWVETRKPELHTLETRCMILHVLTKNRKFKSAESVLTSVLSSYSVGLPKKLFDTMLESYRLLDSSSRVFDSLFKTFAHLKKFRDASDAFYRMRDYGFLPTVESCNAYLSSLLNMGRVDIVLSFYKEMQKSYISPNVYTINMLISAFCKVGKLEKGVELFKEMESKGVAPNVTSYNALITGHCRNGLMSTALKLKVMMSRNGIVPNEVTFNTLMHGFCKEGKLNEANKLLLEMKSMDVSPNLVTYNTLINGYSQLGVAEMGNRVYEEMLRNGIEPDILTYNALILGLCKVGKTKKAAYLVKELDNKKLTPNSSTFSALIVGQCTRKNADRAFQIYKTMIRCRCHPNESTLNLLMTCFCQNEDFDGAVEILREMFGRLLTPDSAVVSKLCCGLRKQGKAELVLELCIEMKARYVGYESFDKEASGLQSY